MARLGGERAVQGDDVARGEERVEVSVPPGEPGVAAGVVDDGYPEARGATRHRGADPAVADEAERRVVDISREVVEDRPARPAALPEIALGVGGEPGGGQDEEEGEVGGRLVEHARGVADGDPQPG